MIPPLSKEVRWLERLIFQIIPERCFYGSMNEHQPEERLLATIAHASIIASGIGITVGQVVYITQKEKSIWTSRQALQATINQLTGRWIDK